VQPTQADPAVSPQAAVSHEDGATADPRDGAVSKGHHEHGMDRDHRFAEVSPASNEALRIFSSSKGDDP